MMPHVELGNIILSRRQELKSLIEQGKINLGGNKQLKIYGTLQCKFGKKMKMQNRVFFVSEKEATHRGYRPCGHCMKSEYQKWKNGLI
jgi:methylphosphotriester-DNA--protein-cysteine methyltransferase